MKVNPNYTYLKENVSKQRISLLQGSTRSGKTFSTIYYLIDLCLNYSGIEIDIVRDTFTALKATAWKDFQQVLIQTDLYREKFHNKTDHTYTLNGNIISYYGADTPDKIHGRSRDLLWVNEAHQFPSETIDQLFPRTRYRIICDYNPALGLEHWLDRYIDKYPPLITTYKDNPYLTPEQVADIESKKDNKYWWSIYGEGQRAARQGAIFDNWTIGEFDTSLPYCYGQDYGFTIDPTTLVKVAVDKKKKVIYCDELLYSTIPMGTDAIIEANRNLIDKPNDLIVADSAEQRLIDDIKKRGLNIIPCVKGQGSVVAGITAMQDYKIIITPRSSNLKVELSNYIWNDKKAGVPIDAFNHCFTGDTIITTINGGVRIDEIKVGDLVLTSKGYKKVLKVFDNGFKQVNKYLMHFDTFILYLRSTNDHKIKTETGWTEISKLQSGEKVYLHKYSITKNIHYTPMKDTFQGVLKECMLLFGRIQMARYPKAITYITKMVMHGIIQLIILNVLKEIFTFLNMASVGIGKIQNGVSSFIQRVLKRLSHGIHQKMELIGTVNMARNVGLIGNIKHLIVSFAERNIKQDTREYLNFAIKTAKLNRLESVESSNLRVYDLMVEDEHEYFANGILVHNCIDGVRYAVVHLANDIKRPRGSVGGAEGIRP